MKARGFIDKKNIRETSGILFISSITSMIAGLTLGIFDNILILIPGLIIMIPGAINARGALYSTLGSRLGSALHLGTIYDFSFKNRLIRDNTNSTFSLNITLSIILAFFAWIVSLLFGATNVTFHNILFASVIGGIVSGFVLMLLCYFISFKSFKRGWDPDNVTSPFITTFTDVVTVPLVIFAGILSFYVPYIETITVLIIVIAIIENVTAFWRKFSYRKIVSQSFLILAMSGIMSSIAGILIQAKLDYFILLPSLLVLFPAFINQGGSIGNVFAARLATRFHLGSLELKFDENMKREIVTSYGVSLLVYPFLALLTYFASHLVGLNITISLVNIIFVTLIAGFLVTTVVIFISFFMARLSYKFNLDPDNVISPVITGTTDIIGVFTLFYIFVLSGIV